jgi:hypothetical protein
VYRCSPERIYANGNCSGPTRKSPYTDNRVQIKRDFLRVHICWHPSVFTVSKSTHISVLIPFAICKILRIM